MTVAIKFEGVSKRYRLGEVGTGTLSHDLHRAWAKLRGKPDPFAKVGAINNREEAGGDYVWALKDIDFEVQQGEVLGIIGRNGAGKSTLLKLLSRVTSPTEGNIKARGRIASLLEVGTGFHPELTGRENIYLNGAILGMRRHEITRQLDDIIDFSGCAKYIDTPVKRYSSGMTVRLGFAVAAFLECEILIVDEVLAVGDAEFQKRCIGKMKEISAGGDRTVLFVSHNMASIAGLCSTGVLLENGTVSQVGEIGGIIDSYMQIDAKAAEWTCDNLSDFNETRLKRIYIADTNGQPTRTFSYAEPIVVHFDFRCRDKKNGIKLGFRVTSHRGVRLFSTEIEIEKCDSCIAACTVPSEFLVPGSYSIHTWLHIPNIEVLDDLEDVVQFEIEETGSSLEHYKGLDFGVIVMPCKWDV